MKEKFKRETCNKNQLDRERAYFKAKKRVGQIKGFYWHLVSYIIINAFILYMIALNVNAEDFWDFNVFSTVIFWGIGLFFHFLGVFVKNIFLSKDWEDRKIQEYIQKEEKHQQWD